MRNFQQWNPDLHFPFWLLMFQTNLSHLAVFAAIARHGSFQKAATETGISTSAASHAIRGLEERLGVSLFHRTTRSVALTEAGQRLLERLQPVLRDVTDALEEMNNFRSTPTGTLRINTSRAAASLLIAPLLYRFLATYPEIRLEITDEDGLIDVVAAGFDAGIRLEESVPEDMVGVRIGGPQRFVLIGAPDYLERHGVPQHPADLDRHNCIRFRFPSGRVYKWEFEQGDTRLEIDVKGQLTVGDQALAVRAALDGLGLAFTFESLVRAEIAQGRLVTVLDEWSPVFAGFMLYYPRQRQMAPALRAFIDMARSYLPG